MADVDKALTEILKLCFDAGPDACPLAKGDATAESTEKAFYDLLETLKTEPIPLPPDLIAYNSTFAAKAVDHSGLRSLLHGTLYHPVNFPLLAAGLDALLSDGGDLETFAKWRDIEGKLLSGVTQNEAQLGVRCSDKDPATRFEKLEEMGEIVEEAAAVSKLGGVGAFAYNCAHWSIDAKERYEGDFKVKTKNPILLTSSTYDPVTPLVSAHNTSASFEGSVVLERTGFGVSDFPPPELCPNGANIAV